MIKPSNFETYLNETLDKYPNSVVLEAMRYSLMAGGKRLRPRLLFSIANNYGADFQEMMLAGAAIEMIHTYSLIHDDLPAMDNDTLRRGKNTCHIEFDEATAILAGDGLLTLAFELISNLKSEHVGEVLKAYALGSGISGMVLGQALDISSDTKDYEDLKKSHQLKTGCLFAASLKAGAIISDQLNLLPLLEKIGNKLGLAFQIQDDILEVTNPQTMLKSSSDSDNKRTTAVTLLGLEKALATFNQEYLEIKELLEKLPRKFPALENIIEELLDRDH